MKRLLSLLVCLLAVAFASPANAGRAYANGPLESLGITCATGPETVLTAYTGYFTDPQPPVFPVAGEIAYIHAVATNTSTCASDTPSIEFHLPPGATFAISSTNPVKCYKNGTLFSTRPAQNGQAGQGCYQTPQQGSNGGALFGWVPLGPGGENLEIQVPVLFSQQLNGSLLLATVNGSWGFKVPYRAVTIYAPPPQNLSVAKTGSGTVTSSPAGIACGLTCSALFPTASNVTLTASPAVNWVFSGWSSGACSGGAPTCVVTMSQAQIATANFTAVVPLGSLSITVAGLPPGSAPATLSIQGPSGFNTTRSASSGTGFSLSDVALGAYTVIAQPVVVGSIRYSALAKTAQVINGSTISLTIAYAANTVLNDVSGDRKADILWREQTSNASAVWLMNGTALVQAAELLPAGTPWSVKRAADFNGDGKADILWQHTDGTLAVWLMNGTAGTGSPHIASPGSGWALREVGDFNGDGKADLLWQHTDGTVMMWLMNGATVSSSSVIKAGGSGWSVKKVGDFDGDGRTDIVWEHSSGQVALWLMDGAAAKSAAVIYSGGPAWSVKDVGDFDGDGKSDILWQHTTGAVALWIMNGLSVANAVSVYSGSSSWSVKQLADFNGDGKADILWQHTDGSIAIWLMSGVAVSSSAIVPNGGNWTIKAVADYDGDGKADILLQQGNGSVTMWLMDGTSISGSATILVFAPRLGSSPLWSPLP